MIRSKIFILATFSIEQALSPIYLACFSHDWRETIPQEWQKFRDKVSDNFRVILVYLIRRETGGLIAFLLPRAI